MQLLAAPATFYPLSIHPPSRRLMHLPVTLLPKPSQRIFSSLSGPVSSRIKLFRENGISFLNEA